MIGLAVARSALRPVRQLSEAAEHIARTEELNADPGHRRRRAGQPRASFNDMLRALQRSRDRQRRLVADAGHELRTPLTSLRTNLELLAQADKRGGMDGELAAGDLRGRHGPGRGAVHVWWVIWSSWPVTSRCPERPSRSTWPTSWPVPSTGYAAAPPRSLFETRVSAWWVVGEAQILERAVTNLLDNAAKWSPAGGTVGIYLHGGELNVTDEGRGSPRPTCP